MAFLALFLRFAKPRKIFDSLRENAYGIYLVHYAFVSWLQFALLGAAWPGFAKGCTVFVGAEKSCRPPAADRRSCSKFHSIVTNLNTSNGK